MAQQLPDEYRFDPAAPRAPTQEQWDRMSDDERARVVDMLPSEFAWDTAPEGDAHRKAKNQAADTLDAFFRRVGRKVYLSSELPIYYPGEDVFAPDVIAVVDAELRDRDSWLVAREGKGLDWAFEVHVKGNRAKDLKGNVERYARLGISEYFIFDRGRLTLRGYRLPSGGRPRVYRPIVPQGGRLTSEVLGLDLALEGSKVRFLLGMAPLPDAEEIVGKLGAMLDDVLGRQVEAEQRAAEAEQKQADAEQRLAELAKRLAAAEAEIERLKRGG
jgi:Uma2 family endonuclease